MKQSLSKMILTENRRQKLNLKIQNLVSFLKILYFGKFHTMFLN